MAVDIEKFLENTDTLKRSFYQIKRKWFTNLYYWSKRDI